MNLANASPVVHLGFPVLAISVAGLFVAFAWASGREGGEAAARRSVLFAALGTAGLFAVSGGLAASSLLADPTRRPPLFLPMMAAIATTTVLTARSAFGRHVALGIPLWLLVASQGFRLPLELVMHEASLEGVMPPQMSFQGLNFDIVTGASALLLAAWLRFGTVPRAVLVLWNAMGTLLLAVIVTVALVSAPWLALFGPDRVNDFVLHVPYVWLPAVLVPFALFGHLSLFRRLGAETGRTVTPRRTDGSLLPGGAHPPARAG